MQAIDSVLYKSSDGQVVVTKGSVALGAEAWPTEDIKGVRLEAKRQLRFVWWLKINRDTIPPILLTAVCFFGGFALAWLSIGSPLQGAMVAGALLLYGVGFAAGIVTWLRSCPQRYNLWVTVARGVGAPQPYKAAYTWQEHTEATTVYQAVQQAITK